MLAAIRRYPFTTLFVAAILVVCMIPIPDTPLSEVSLIDKWTHVAMYAALEVVMFTELNRRRASLSAGRLLVAPAALGGLVELMQAYLTTYRSGEWADFAADCVGVLAGALVGRFVITPVFRRVRRR